MTHLHRLAATALTALAAASNASAQSRIYFSEYEFNNARVRSMGLDGSNPQTLFALPTSEWLPVGLSFEPVSQLLYVADMASPDNLARVASSGAGYVNLLNVTGSPRAPRFDGAGRMYYSAGNQVYRANLNGSGQQLLFTATQSWPMSAVAVDGTNGHVYFGADRQIRRMNLDGSNVVTVVRGASSIRDVEVDVAAGYVYWLDADTISDCVCRARLDGTDFTVLVDNSPNVVQSGGLIALLVDRVGGKLYFADDLFDRVERTDLNGGSRSTIYSIASGPSPSGLCFDVAPPPQAVADCNANGAPDALDIAGGSSADCNLNGVPDECELDPCPSFTFLVDRGSNPLVPSLTVGGPGPAPTLQFEVFTPLDVPPGGWNVGEIHLDGFTANYGSGAGFSATLFPDNGANFPDESAPIASRDYQFYFDTQDTLWVRRAFDVALPAGRHWLRLRSNQPGVYHAGANIGTSGPTGWSRRGDGALFSASPVGLRVTQGCAAPQSYCTAKLSSSGCLASVSSSGVPTPGGGFAIQVSQVEGQRSGLVFHGSSGAVAAPFQGGFLCVNTPLVRLPPQLSGGSSGACNGAFAYSLDALLSGAPAGAQFWLQAWFRDPLSPSTTGLSNALAFTRCP